MDLGHLRTSQPTPPPPTPIPATAPTAIIVDLLGTLAAFHPELRLARLMSMSDRTAGDIQQAIWGSGFDAACDVGAHDRGRIHAQLCEALGRNVSWQDLVEAWSLAFSVETMPLEALGVLHRHRRVWICSNNGPLLEDALRATYPEVFTCCIDVVCSWRLGHLKATPAGFSALRERLGHPAPKNMTFIDDDMANNLAFRELGAESILCPDEACLEGILTAYFGPL